MSTKLDEFLEEIDPSRTVDVMDARVSNAMNSFRYPHACITDWEEFRRCLTDFSGHIENSVFRANIPRYVELDWHHCCQILIERYGRSGDKAAFEMARTGNEGGLYAVLKVIARGMANKYVESEVSAKVSAFLKSLSADEIIEAADEYVEKYGKLLPSELIENGAPRIKANFAAVLEKHPWMIHDLRNVGR